MKKVNETYDKHAKEYLSTRIKSDELAGWQCRELEQPTMFGLVPSNLTNKKVLDVGCGPGIHLKEYIKRGAVGYGVDISSEMIRLAKLHCSKGEFSVERAEKLGFDDESFDIVTSSFALDHVKDLKIAFHEFKRVLKKNGLLIFSVPHPIHHMFRDTPKHEFKPSHSYYDKKVNYVRVVKEGELLEQYPKQLQDYFEPLLKKGFILLEFQENKPNKEWLDKYKDFDKNRLKHPSMCFFRWKKG